MARALDGVLVGALARARAQAGALAAALALLVLAATLAGTSAHLLTGGQDAALAAALSTATPEDVTAVVRASFDGRGASATTGPEQQAALDDAAAALTAGSAPAPVEAWTAWTSSARYLEPDGSALPASGRDLQSGTLAAVGSFRLVDEGGGDDARGGDGGLAAHADLVSGRWPAPTALTSPGPDGAGGALEVAVPESAVDASGGALRRGATAVLAPAPADETASAPLRVVVVGTYRPRADDPAWQLDPLRAAGTATAADVPGTSGRVQRPAVGPLLLDPGALAAVDGPSVVVASGGVVVVPQLSDLTADDARALATTAASVPPPQTAVREALGDRVSGVSVLAALPRLLERSAAEQRTAGAGLLVAAAVGAGAVLVALVAVAQLLAERRREESVLLATRGASPAQQVVRDAAEVVPLALGAVLLAGVLSTLTARALLGSVLGGPDGAAPVGEVDVTAGAPLAVAAATGVLAVVVVLLALARGRAAVTSGGPGRATRAPLRSPLVRSGADLLLLGVAVAAWWQLRSGDARAAGGVVLVVAPVLALLASALLGLRVLSLLRRAGERTARRSARAPRAVAGWALARGPVAAGTAALVVLAAATTTTALAWRTAWSDSTAQQVTAALGADVVVETPPVEDGGVGALRTAAALAAATGADPSPVTVLPVALGTRSGAGPVSLVAAPAARSSTGPSVLEGPALPAGTVRLVVTGRGQGDGALAGRLDVPALRVAPSLVVRDPWGTTAVLEGQPVVLEGQPHEVALPDPGATGQLQVVGAWLRLLPSDDDAAPLAGVDQRIEVRLALPDTSDETSADWTTTSGGDGTDGAVTSSSARVEPGGGGSSVVVDAVVRPAGLPLTGLALRALAAPAPEALAVRVSPELAAQVGAAPGQQLALSAGEQQLVAQVTAVVPVVPTAAGAPALLVEPGALDAALLSAGAVPVPDRWWLLDLAPERQRAAVAAVEAAGLGSATALDEAVVRAQRAPLAAALRAAWLLLLVAAAAAALAGPALQVAAAAPEDARTSARLAVLGVSRRERVRVVVGPGAVQLALGLLVGAVAGAVVAVAVVPVLVRAPDGGVAVPRVDAALVLRSALTGAPLPESLAVLGGLVALAAVPLLLAGVAAVRREGTR